MSNYFYKSINVKDICANNNTTQTVGGFAGMPTATSTNYSGLRPLTFGYKTGVSNTDLLNSYTARNTGIITTDSKIAIPTNVKSFRVISVGGGGGSGGQGGKASSESGDSNDSSTSYGGNGGDGGYGDYTYGNFNTSGRTNISIVTGDIGNTGTEGGSDKANSNYNALNGWNNSKVSGDPGTSGGPGKASYIMFDTDATQYVVANGGNGGIGGYPATANASHTKASSSKGDPGAAGTPSSSQATDTNFPPLSTYGNPSTAGAVQIIWLYD